MPFLYLESPHTASSIDWVFDDVSGCPTDQPFDTASSKIKFIRWVKSATLSLIERSCFNISADLLPTSLFTILLPGLVQGNKLLGTFNNRLDVNLSRRQPVNQHLSARRKIFVTECSQCTSAIPKRGGNWRCTGQMSTTASVCFEPHCEYDGCHCDDVWWLEKREISQVVVVDY